MAATTAPPPPLPLPNELILLAEAQWLFPESDLLHTPSVVAGLTPTQERENRAKGVNFILQVGIMLKLPQITLATASMFLHRFFMRYPMVEDRVAGRQHQHYYSIAATCLFLATKVEENCRKMKDLVVACVRVAQKEPNKEVDEQDKEFWRWRDVILQLEDLLLESLCFDLSLESPYKLLYNFLVHFQEENNKPLRNAAWAFVNDSCLTPLCLLYPARTIAAAAIYAAARHCEVKLLDDERGRPWWEVVSSDLTSIRKACNYMASLYENVATSTSNGDTGKSSIYQHTPESGGEERFAKTRAYRPGVSPQDSRQSSPLSGPLSHNQPLQSTKDRDSRNNHTETRNGQRSNPNSEYSRKRSRDSNSEEGEIEDDEGETNSDHSKGGVPIPWGGEETSTNDQIRNSHGGESEGESESRHYRNSTKRRRTTRSPSRSRSHSRSRSINGNRNGNGTASGSGNASRNGTGASANKSSTTGPTKSRTQTQTPLPTTITTATALGVTIIHTDSNEEGNADRKGSDDNTNGKVEGGDGDREGSEEGEL